MAREIRTRAKGISPRVEKDGPPMTITIDGEYTTATVMLERDQIEDLTYEQVEEMTNHPGFRNEVVVQPDCHPGAGCVIGFTMPLGEQVVPNVVGVDIGCFTGDTEVELLDGKDHRMDKLSERDEPFGVWSCKPDGEVVAAEATARKTRSDASLVRVTLDNGEAIECTPDHEFMLRDGSYCEARDLMAEQSLMPFYTETDEDGYRQIYQNLPQSSYQRGHWVVARSGLLGPVPSYDDQKTIIHHKNFTEHDNRPSNLEYMGACDHSTFHRNIVERNEHWQSDAFEEARIEAIKRSFTKGGAMYEQRAAQGTENITTWMAENPEAFARSVEGNGERGKKYLREFNTSQRVCDLCDELFDNPAAKYWHQVKEHPEETEYNTDHKNAQSTMENHEVVSVEKLDRTEEVYCLNVPEHHNFALSAGVFVHNCGMLAVELDEEPDLSKAEIDDRIRETIPMGWHAHDDQSYHVGNDFPWAETTAKIERLQEGLDQEFEFEGYDLDYFKDLCEKAGVDLNKAINQIGTLGGGNHFIEIAESERTGNWWIVFHSGSRALGNSVAGYWQERATEYQNETALAPLSDVEIPGELRAAGASASDLTGEGGRRIEMDTAAAFCREQFEGSEIEANVNRIRQVRYDREQDSEGDRNTDLDYLEGEAAHGYLIDMAFCQTYAWENRRQMASLVTDALGVEMADSIHSPHNLIDFEDLVIRKGATRAHDGERFIVPYNMGDGSVVLRGKGNSEWNRSAPHGAGRRGSRRWAKTEFSMAEFETAMEGVFSTSVSKDTLDEAPMSYKNPETIESRIDETGEIIDRLRPVINCKADW